MREDLVHIHLRRFYTPTATFGTLYLPEGWECKTIERPWVQGLGINTAGQRSVSCIPEATYRGHWLHSPAHGETWRLTNRHLGVAMNDGPGVNRHAIQLHAGNIVDDVQGCIAPGAFFGCIKSQWSVVDSRETMDEIRARTRRYALQDKIVLFHISHAGRPRGVRMEF